MHKATLIVGALIGAVALMLLPLAWVKILGSPTSTAATDPLNLITSAATVMGGILVAGGLVALLGSIATFLAIEDKVAGLLEKEVKKIEIGVIDNIQSFYQVTRTIHQEDWRLAQRETERLLEETGEIPGARFELAERLFMDIVKAFRGERDCKEVTVVIEMDNTQAKGIPRAEAWARLEAASQRKEGPPCRANALLGLLKGYDGDWTGMWEWLLRPVGSQNACLRHRPLLLKPYHVAMLCSACDTEAKLGIVGKELGITLPAEWGVVERSLKDLERGEGKEVGWWTWRSPEEQKLHPQFPFPRALTITLASQPGDPVAAFHVRAAGLDMYESNLAPLPEWDGRAVVGIAYFTTLHFLCPADEADVYTP